MLNLKPRQITQNIILLPLIMISLQCCYLFVALFGSGLFFEKTVLITAFCILFAWGFAFIKKTRKTGIDLRNKWNLILIVCLILFCLFFIQQSWFFHYLRLDVLKQFFKGYTHIDPLWHAVHAESILTNGYPSLLQNSEQFRAYHCFSHYIIAGISRLLDLPAIITYNYLYPVIFFPLFLFFSIKTLSICKNYFNKESSLEFIDYLFMLTVFLGIFSKQIIQKDIWGFFMPIPLFGSESSLISLVILLAYCPVIKFLSEKIKGFNTVNLYFLIPVFIVIISYTKLSAGFIFCLGCCYYVFRKYLFKEIKCLLFIEYLLVFCLFYWINYRFLAGTGSSSGSGGGLDIKLFAYVRRRDSIFHWFAHYIFLFLPVVIILKETYRGSKIKEFLFSKRTIFQEMVFLLMLAACLPGVFLEIHGGSAAYFFIPVYLFSWILFLSSGILSKISVFSVSFIKREKTLAKIPAVPGILLFLYFSLIICNINFPRTVVETMRGRMHVSGVLQDIPGSVKRLFSPVELLEDSNYIMFNKIRKEVSEAPQDYCIYLSGNSDLFVRYDNYYRKNPNMNYCLRSNLAVSAYLGLPIINSVYMDGDMYYRADGKLLGERSQFQAYSLPPAVCGEKITEENMIERARELDKKYIVVIRQHSYSIVNVN